MNPKARIEDILYDYGNAMWTSDDKKLHESTKELLSLLESEKKKAYVFTRTQWNKAKREGAREVLIELAKHQELLYLDGENVVPAVRAANWFEAKLKELEPEGER